MTTTQFFQKKPDFYNSEELCKQESRKKEQTNIRYKYFNQTHFTAGDEEQFDQYRDEENGNLCDKNISLENNLFKNNNIIEEWDKYKNVDANCVINTFRYIFHKFKKGIFVKILDNKLRVFLPFSKANFINEWSDKIEFDGSMYDFFRNITEKQGYKFNPKHINQNIKEWYGNNCLFRYEYPINEGDTNVDNVKNMLEEVCNSRKVPDIEFFINRRDFPILTRDGTEPYNNIWGSKKQPLVSHLYDKYLPILSMCGGKRYADVLIPNWEDWARISSYEGKWFAKSCKDYNQKFETPWKDKYPIAVFRGGSTGCGVDVESNMRLKVSFLSKLGNIDENDGLPYLDAGIANWNLRPRKLEKEKFIKTIDIDKLGFDLVSFLSPKEQSKYKYIIHLDGHTAAFRLSIEMSMCSVILLQTSKWKSWYRDLLIPYVHFVPIKEDLSDLIDQIKWCKENDSECEKIANNSLKFFNKYLCKEAILDYVQKTFVDIKEEIGIYLYNVRKPLDFLIDEEYKNLNYKSPILPKFIKNPNEIPKMPRCYGLLQGIEWSINRMLTEDNFEYFCSDKNKIFQNKLGVIYSCVFAKFGIIMKTTNDFKKKKENIHEAFIGTKQVNSLLQIIPNFNYVFGLYEKEDTISVITEKISGETLDDYLNGNNFNFKEFLFILIQLSLAIQVSQKNIGFIHHDLTPWNIMLQKIAKPIEFDYVLSYNKIIRIKTTIIPVIIDYGKSHVIHSGIHHGFINMFACSRIQDVLTLLITSVKQLLTKNLSQDDFRMTLSLSNFITGTKYRYDKFQNAKDLRNFVKQASKYASLISEPKYELEQKVPYDFIEYILEITKNKYKFDISSVNKYNSLMNRGNSRQVYEYIFCNNVDDQLETYKNVFINLKHCMLPQPKNLLLNYYSVQLLETNLNSVKDNMLLFLKKNNLNPTEYIQFFNDSINYIDTVYNKNITQLYAKKVNYLLSTDFDVLSCAKYNEETFLLPNKIFSLINESIQNLDLSEYKDIVENILIYDGKYKLPETIYNFYFENFHKLLDIDNFVMKNNVANHNTIIYITKELYTENEIKWKNQNVNSKNCFTLLQYLTSYKKIFQIIKNKNNNI